MGMQKDILLPSLSHRGRPGRGRARSWRGQETRDTNILMSVGKQKASLLLVNVVTIRIPHWLGVGLVWGPSARSDLIEFPLHTHK